MSKTIASKPAAYTRHNKEWQHWLGRRGEVAVSTYIKTAGEECAAMTPYSYAVVDFDGERLELMGAGHEKLAAGQEVECVLRKNPAAGHQGLINYVLKVKRV